MNLESKIETLIGPTVAALGYRTVCVKLFAKPRRTLQVMVERADGATVSLDDCTLLSRALGALLDADDPVPGNYDLEVSSAGIDRPLVRPEDFRRFAGLEASASVDPPLDGQRRFRGRLAGMDGDDIRLEQAAGRIVALPFERVVEARLVLNDELLAASAPPRQPASE